MTPSRKRWLGTLGIVCGAFLAPTFSSHSSAQVPSVSPLPADVPAAAAAAPGGALAAAGPAGAAAAAPAAPQTLWGFLGLSKANCAACRDKLCQSQLGMLLNNAVGPANALAGGMVPALCPPALPPTAAQLAAMNANDQTGATAAAAQIKAQEAAAKARVAAVEYLGTVDCRYYPNARKALIAALRADPNECVRFAAARALNSGCCCNKDTIKALQIVVAGDDADGSPPELSPRVRGESFAALQNCLMRVPEVIPVEPVKPEGPAVRPETVPPVRPEAGAASGGAPSHVAASYLSVAPQFLPQFEDMLRKKTFAQVVDEARYTMFRAAERNQSPDYMPTGKRSVFHALVKARQDMTQPRNEQGQGQAQPRTGPAQTANRKATVDPNLQPASFTPPAAPATIQPEMKPDAVPTDVVEPAVQPTPAPRRSRSVFGLFSR